MSDCDISAFPRYLSAIAKAKRIPLSAQFELTARCNFNCRMCYIHMDDKRIKEQGQELTTDEWLRLAKEAKEIGTLYLTLSGGEVFTRADFEELYEKLSEMGFLITIMTNASLITDDVIKWLSKRPPFYIRISLYGSTDDVYQSVCRVPHAFSNVDKALSLLQESNIPISLKSVLIKNNAADIKNMYQYAANRKLKLQIEKGIVKSVRGAVSDAVDVRFEPWLEESINPDYSKYKKDENGRGPYRHHPNYLDDCYPYGHSFNVTWDGRMILCSFMDSPFVDLRTTPVKDAWRVFLNKIDSIKKPDACYNCEYEDYCTRCPGSLSAECGSYSQVSSSFCQRAKRLYKLYNTDI